MSIAAITDRELYRFLNEARTRLERIHRLAAGGMALTAASALFAPVVAMRSRMELRDSLFAFLFPMTAAVIFALIARRLAVRIQQVPESLEVEISDRDRVSTATEFIGEEDPFKRLAVRQNEEWITQERERLARVKSSKWPYIGLLSLVALVLLWWLTPSWRPPTAKSLDLVKNDLPPSSTPWAASQPSSKLKSGSNSNQSSSASFGASGNAARSGGNGTPQSSGQAGANGANRSQSSNKTGSGTSGSKRGSAIANGAGGPPSQTTQGGNHSNQSGTGAQGSQSSFNAVDQKTGGGNGKTSAAANGSGTGTAQQNGADGGAPSGGTPKGSANSGAGTSTSQNSSAGKNSDSSSTAGSANSATAGANQNASRDGESAKASNSQSPRAAKVAPNPLANNGVSAGVPGGSGSDGAGKVKLPTGHASNAGVTSINANKARPSNTEKERETSGKMDGDHAIQHASSVGDVNFGPVDINSPEVETLPPRRREVVIEYFRAMRQKSSSATSQPSAGAPEP